jgi:hypothetical protein
VNNPQPYFDILYPFQDRVLKVINAIETDFYLTGGTAASRGYLNHRFSDDLDLFVNDDDRFGLWVERIIQALLRQSDWKCTVDQNENRFARLTVKRSDLALKIELINDVPARVGQVSIHPALGLLDREEPKDLADIWGFCCRMDLSLMDAITNAQSKAAGVFPADLARVLCSATYADWEAVRWIQPPPEDSFLADLNTLGEKLLRLE